MRRVIITATYADVFKILVSQVFSFVRTMPLDATIKIYMNMFSFNPVLPFSPIHMYKHTHTQMLPHAQKYTHKHFPFRSWENDNKKAHRSSRPLTSDPWRSPTACTGDGGGLVGGDKRHGGGGALIAAPCSSGQLWLHPG